MLHSWQRARRKVPRTTIQRRDNRTHLHKACIQERLYLIRYIKRDEKPTISLNFGGGYLNVHLVTGVLDSFVGFSQFNHIEQTF